MGFAAKEELLTFLNELLEAERASARIAARTAADTTDREMAVLMKHIHGDEVRWCAMLYKWIRRLEGEPSSRVGDFYEKCLAIADLTDRAMFINRGQGWVVRELPKMLRQVRNDELHADLADMLKSHEENIARTNALLA
jgi:nitronate monooxygenase